MIKIAITGATGFVGNHVLNELIKNNELELTCIVRSRSRVQHQIWTEKAKIVEYNIGDPYSGNLFQYFNSPDILLHLAWEGLPNYGEFFHIERNLMRDYFFITRLYNEGLKEAVISGTCFEYGLINGKLTEDMLTDPVIPYGISKDTLRKFIETYCKKNNKSYKWLRLFYMYGEGQSQNSIMQQLINAINNNEKYFNMSSGEQIRDYLNVKEMAKYIVVVLLSDFHGIINCCSGKPISIRALVENYLTKTQSSILLNLGFYSYPDYEPLAFWGDNSKLLKIIDQREAYE